MNNIDDGTSHGSNNSIDMPNNHSTSAGVFEWLRRIGFLRPKLGRSSHKDQESWDLARSHFGLFRTMPSSRDRDVGTSSSPVAEADISNRFDTVEDEESEPRSQSADVSPEMYELEISALHNGDDDYNDNVSQTESISQEVHELDAEWMNELILSSEILNWETGSEIESDMDDSWSEVSAESFDAHADTLSISMPNALRFLEELNFVDIEDIGEDCRHCVICTDQYGEGPGGEVPVVLNCGHVFGQRCLEKWLCPFDFDPKRTCPMCRTVLFEEDRYNTRAPPEGPESISPAQDETMSEEDVDEDIEYSDAAEILASIEQTNRSAEIYDRSRARHHSLLSGAETADTASPEDVLPSRYRTFWFSADVLFSLRLLIRRNSMSALETREVAQVIRGQMGRLYLRLRDAMHERRMPIVWTEDGPPLSFLLDPAATPLLESALERLGELEEMWDWNDFNLPV